jgi:cell division transport system ATP-binding protein
MIRFAEVSKSYPGKRDALSGVTLHLAPGELAFLTGRSGAGKSTMLRLIALMERHSRGQIIIGGKNTARLPRRQRPQFRRRIGFIFQDHRLLTDRTVFDNVALPLVIADYRRRDILKRVRAALDQVGLLGKERLYPAALSGGEQQRVGIARAVVHKPDILLADEPTGNLDPGLSWEIMQLFGRFSDVGVTVLVATHDLSLIERLPYRIIVLENGSIYQDHPAEHAQTAN